MLILRCCFLCFILSFVTTVQGQERLSESDFSGDSIYIYRLNREDLNLIYRKEKEPNESNLHTLVARYPRNGNLPELPRGNYMLVQAHKNILKYDSHVVDDLIYHIFSGDNLLLYLSDSSGKTISQAAVRLGRCSLYYDAEAEVYTIKQFRKERLLEIENNGVYHYVLLKPGNQNRFSRKGKFWERGMQGEFSSFVMYSKPKYKPGEQVKFKAFLQSSKGKLIDEPVEVCLRGSRVDTVLTTLYPYRPGFYKYEFLLSDGIKYELDRSYWVELRSATSKKVYTAGAFFRIEEYELKGIRFNCTADNRTHHRQNPPSIFIEITDENGMAVLNGDCRITVSALWTTVRPQWNDAYLQKKCFVPNQLWETSFVWNGERKKEVVLPDSIFPLGVSFAYKVNCVYLTPDNERYEKNIFLDYDGRESMIRFTSIREGVLIEQITNGKVDTVMAQVKGVDQNNKIISTRTVQLPFSQRWGEHVSFYSVKSDKTEGTYWESQSFQDYPVSCQLSKEKDSLWIIIRNPYEYPCWYRLYRDKKVLEEGAVKQLNQVRKVKEKGNYYLFVDYLIGGKMRHLNQEILNQEKSMNIRLQTPEMVSPGQTTQMELEVVDYLGRPVADVDVTASAITSKFGFFSFSSPFVWINSQKPEQNRFIVIRSKDLHHQAKMNWKRWKKEMNLDRELAYQFMYPEPLFRTEELGQEGITQLAPFAFIDGEMQTVYLLEVDGLPYYYYRSEHLGGYSFPITPGKHELTLHLYDRIVRLREFEVYKGLKNIVSLDVTESVPEIGLSIQQKAKKQQGNWTEAERRLLSQHLFRVCNNFGYKQLDGLGIYMGNLAYLYAEPFIYPLTRQEFSSHPSGIRGKKSWLVGPFLDWRPLALYINEEKIHEFPVEGGKRYIIRKDYLKLKEEEMVPQVWIRTTPKFDLKAFVTSPKKMQKQWEEGIKMAIKRYNKEWYVDDNLKDTTIAYPKSYWLIIDSKHSQNMNSHYLTLFYHADQKIWQIYSGDIRIFRNLLTSNPKMFMIFDQDRYYECQLDLKADGINYQLFDSVEIKVQPPIFTKWLEQCIQQKIINSKDAKELLPHDKQDSLLFLEGDDYLLSGEENVKSRGMVLTGSAVKVSRGEKAVSADMFFNKEIKRKDISANIKDWDSMILLNGQPYSGSIEDIDVNRIVSLKVLPEEKALELFGEQGRNGVLLITTSISEEEEGVGKALRHNFRDDAFWEPALRTKQDGKVSFSVTWPDDITSWNARFFAVDEKQRFGNVSTMIKSFKSFAARLAVPHFVIEGDSTHLIGKMNNYVGDSLSVKRQFSVNGNSLEKYFSFFTSHIDTLPIRVVSGDSLRFQYSMEEKSGFFDGEERTIPVLKQGIQESQGIFQVLQADSLYRFRLEPSLGEVTIYAETTPLELLLREIEQIEHYPYASNEQNAFKLKALLLKRRVCQLLQKPFKEEKKIKKLISDLEKNQNGDGLWGWWGKQPTEEWISMQVLEALLAANQAGYTIKWNRQLLVAKLVQHLQEVTADLNDFPEERLGCLNRLVMLKALEEPLNYSLFFHRIAQGKWHSMHEELWALRVKQLIGLSVTSEEVLRFAQESMLGGLYWEKVQSDEKNRSNGYYLPQDNRIQNTLLAYQLLRDLGGHERELQRIRNYFFEMRRSGHWNSIYDASRILEVVFAEELSDKHSLDSMRMVINGEEITRFPFTLKYKAGEELEVQKQGSSPIYFTAYQESWNKVPVSQSNGFQVQTYFRKELKSVVGSVTPKEERIKVLKAGESVELVVQVQPEKDAHYVMVEIPIPAGCSYESKSQSRWQETHREYGKEKVTIFCRYLQHDSKNPTVFTVKLMPRFSGKYHLNPASVELMYFPIFNGRTGMKEIPIR